VAFNGFGDAISAVLDGDPEKLAEAMERLAPAAQVIVREFQRVLPIFRDVGKEIQQGFFVQLNTILERFGTGTLPRVRDELRRLSGALGNAVAGMASLLVESKNVGILERLFESTERSVEMLGEAFYALGQSFLNAIDAGLPSLEVLTSRLAGAIESFATFINASIENGSFQEFLDDAIATLDELLALGGAVGELLGVLFGSTDDAGRGFLGTLTGITQRITEFFKSAEGQDTLEDFTELILLAGTILGWAANALIFFTDLFADVDDAIIATNKWLMQLGADIVQAWNAVVGAVSSAIDSIGQFFTETGDAAASWWDGVVEAVSTAVDTVLAIVSAIPGQIVAFVESIPGAVIAVFDLMIDGMIAALAIATATVIVFFTDLPGQITGALVALLGLAKDTFDTLLQIVIESFNAVVAFVESVPGLLVAAWDFIVQQVTNVFNSINQFIITSWEATLAFLSSIPDRVAAFFQRMNDAATDRVNTLIERVKGIPGQIISALGDLARLLYNSGANIIQGLIDGISSRIGQLRDKIASAVQAIRDHLPFSPAKTGPLSGSGSPQIAGAVIAEMIAAGLDAGTPLITQAAGRAAGASTSPFGAIGQAGVNPLTSSTSGQPGGVLSPTSDRTDEQLVVIVNIDGEELTAIIDRRVDTAVSTEVRRLLAGTRGI
jgi:phage-related protein